MVSKVSLALFALLVFTGFAYAQTPTLNWKVASESPNADSASNMTLGTLRTLIVAGTGSGSVTSVNATVPTGLSVTSSAITTSGNIVISNNLAAGFVSSAGVNGALTSSTTIAGSAITGNIAGNAANVTGTVAVANGGSGATTLSGLLKGNGTSAFTAAVAGTDYVIPSGNVATATTATSATTATTAGNVTGTVAVANGGTGTTTLTGYLSGNGTAAVTASATIPTTALSGTVTNAQLANNAITINGTSTALGGTASITLLSATTAGSTTNVASTYSGGLTSLGTTAISATLVEAPSTTVTTTGTIGTSAAQMPLNITSNSTLTITAGAASGTLMDCKMIPTSTAQVIFTSSSAETFNGNATFTVVAGSQNTTVKFYKYSTTAWTVSVTQ